jgi:bifunctional UDP-N-acetylglucosamine pyrophosphorylase/glucosamine-1-phosphate N-acetyltransferase
MQAVILAAGRGKRMRNLTDKNNKNMLHVGGYPILKHKLDLLPEEIDEVIFVIGYQGNKIRREFGNRYKGRKITYEEQKRLNGTGGAIHRAKKLLKGKFLVMYGDDLYDKGDVQKIIKYDLAILAKKVKDVSKFGILKTDKKGNLKEIKEKPKRSKSKLAAIGLFMLNKNFFKFKLVSVGNGEYGLPQTLASMAKEFDIKILEARRWYPIGTPEDLENAQMAIKRFV